MDSRLILAFLAFALSAVPGFASAEVESARTEASQADASRSAACVESTGSRIKTRGNHCQSAGRALTRVDLDASGEPASRASLSRVQPMAVGQSRVQIQ